MGEVQLSYLQLRQFSQDRIAERLVHLECFEMASHQGVWSEVLARMSRNTESSRMTCRATVIVGWTLPNGRTMAKCLFVMFPELLLAWSRKISTDILIVC